MILWPAETLQQLAGGADYKRAMSGLMSAIRQNHFALLQRNAFPVQAKGVGTNPKRRSLKIVEKFELIPIAREGFAPLTQAVMYEKVAARYVMLGIHEFRELVHKGIIPYRTRSGHSRRIYLKSDLDSYLAGLPIGGKMGPSEDSSDSVPLEGSLK